MEEYAQITLDQWLQWKEDIRAKLAETAENFVYIGYRLKQIRDSGMYGGAADIFEFALKEYGLGKSTVSRFIAINERYSEGGNSLELKDEFKKFSSSKLAEMLTLPDSEIQLITERTTVQEIRVLKEFNRQQAPENDDGERTPLENCLIDFFRSRKQMLNEIMDIMGAMEQPDYKKASEAMNPAGQSSHKKGIVFLFMFGWETGVKYKLLTDPEPVRLTWPELLDIVYSLYAGDAWEDFYGSGEETVEGTEENTAPILSDQGLEAVATSQQERDAEAEEKQEIARQREQEVPREDVSPAADVEKTEEPEEKEVSAQACTGQDLPQYIPEKPVPYEAFHEDIHAIWDRMWDTVNDIRARLSDITLQEPPRTAEETEELHRLYNMALSLAADAERILNG